MIAKHSETLETQIAIRVTADRLEALDELRRREKDVPTRAEIVRRLIDRAAARR
jgi:hypothetical protein